MRKLVIDEPSHDVDPLRGFVWKLSSTGFCVCVSLSIRLLQTRSEVTTLNSKTSVKPGQ